MVLIRTDYRIRVLSTRKWYRFILSKESSDKNRVRFLSRCKRYRFILSKEGFQFYISLLIHFGKLVGEEAVLKFHFEVATWYDWYSFFRFIFGTIREGAFAGWSWSFIWKLIWFIWSIPTSIIKFWIIKFHFDSFLTRTIFWCFLSRVALLYVAYPDPKVATLWIILLPLAPIRNLWIS